MMDMKDFKYVVLNKNRGWRGLAEADIVNDDGDTVLKMIFSFSQAVWDDVVKRHIIVMQDKDCYYVIKFEPMVRAGKLPRVDQQRTVLIKNFVGKIEDVVVYGKEAWRGATERDWNAIRHSINNKNNHTTSDWNCIGVRVRPEI